MNYDHFVLSVFKIIIKFFGKSRKISRLYLKNYPSVARVGNEFADF